MKRTLLRSTLCLPAGELGPVNEYQGDVRSALTAVRKALRDGGFTLQVSTGRFSQFGGGDKQSTAGFDLHRVGCGPWVAVGWRDEYRHGRTLDQTTREERMAKDASAVAYLRSLGFPFDNRGWMTCRWNDLF